jgi:hypothetical protein
MVLFIIYSTCTLNAILKVKVETPLLSKKDENKTTTGKRIF